MGLDCPSPGIAACQAMFLDGDHSSGSESAATAEAPCPKKAGQAPGTPGKEPGASAAHKLRTTNQAGDMGTTRRWRMCTKAERTTQRAFGVWRQAENCRD